jgi:hypothetical protein
MDLVQARHHRHAAPGHRAQRVSPVTWGGRQCRAMGTVLRRLASSRVASGEGCAVTGRTWRQAAAPPPRNARRETPATAGAGWSRTGYLSGCARFDGATCYAKNTVRLIKAALSSVLTDVTARRWTRGASAPWNRR